MEEITSREFSAICKERGFTKRKSVYSRCIGDGVYQNLFIGDKAFMNPSSPEYTNTHRKSQYISIRFWSMYSNVPEFFYTEGEHIGVFTPENLLGQRFSSDTFFGIQAEYQIMLTKGFDFLDSIVTQKKLLDAVIQLQSVEFSQPIPHDTQLCAPYLICGEPNEAYNRLNALYTQNWTAFHCNYDLLRKQGHIREYLEKEDEYLEHTAPTVELLNLVLGKDNRRIQQYLRDCFQRNVRLAQENGISFAADFAPCDFV